MVHRRQAGDGGFSGSRSRLRATTTVR